MRCLIGHLTITVPRACPRFAFPFLCPALAALTLSTQPDSLALYTMWLHRVTIDDTLWPTH